MGHLTHKSGPLRLLVSFLWARGGLDDLQAPLRLCCAVSSSGSGAVTLSSPCCRLLEEESAKRAELEKWHLEQQQAIQTTEAEKQELENQRVIKEQALQEALGQLQQLELERKQALEQYEVIAHPRKSVHLSSQTFKNGNVYSAVKSCVRMLLSSK